MRRATNRASLGSRAALGQRCPAPLLGEDEATSGRVLPPGTRGSVKIWESAGQKISCDFFGGSPNCHCSSHPDRAPLANSAG